MSDSQFVVAVLARLPAIEPSILSTLKYSIRQQEIYGFTVDEAVQYCMCIREFSPEMDEETALDRMSALKAIVDERNGYVRRVVI